MDVKNLSPTNNSDSTPGIFERQWRINVFYLILNSLIMFMKTSSIIHHRESNKPWIHPSPKSTCKLLSLLDLGPFEPLPGFGPRGGVFKDEQIGDESRVSDQEEFGKRRSGDDREQRSQRLLSEGEPKKGGGYSDATAPHH